MTNNKNNSVKSIATNVADGPKGTAGFNLSQNSTSSGFSESVVVYTQDNITFSNNINKKQWESFIDTLQFKSVLQSWTWGELELLNKANFYRWAIYNKDKLIGLVSAKFVNAKRGKFLQLRHGPILDWKSVPLKDLKIILHGIKNIAKNMGAWAVRFQPYWLESTELNTKLKLVGAKLGTNHEVDAERTVQIDLTLPQEKLWSNMRMSTRQRIRQTEKLGIKIKHTNTMEYWDIFENIFLDTVNRHKWKAQSIKFIKRQYELFSKTGLSEMFVAFYKGEPISASMFTFYKDVVIYHHSGSLSKFRKIPASYGIQWELIKYAKQKGYKLYDMWGTAPRENKNHPWYGLSIFKWGFGGQEKKFMHAHDLIINPMWYLTRIYETIEGKKWK